ncbi:MAG: hypothetical protein A2V99_18790 [Spirochaetes bacterium RBG_16_67_19]|nr:MAG: hypothetical protein A2V99_18790 [Spirochaetes bacterium RBG_16_67_19]
MSLIFLAGTPAILILGSLKDLLTTEFAPIAMPLAIWIGPKIFTPGPMYTLSPIFGAWKVCPALVPMLTPAWILQFAPILAAPLTMMVP